jgi:AcrR family transcriptional regulator
MNQDHAGPPRLAGIEPTTLDSQTVRKRDTRQQLILAAERLFAERGIDGVSLREINVAAKQRNTSAAHYHFGSKEALIDAIFEFRRGEVGKRREELLDAMEASGHVDARALAEALIEPLAAVVQGTESGRYYLEFLAQLMVTSPQTAGAVLRKHNQAATMRWVAVASKALPNIPRHILRMRSLLMARHALMAMTLYLRRGLGLEEVNFEGYLSDMIDSVAGYVTAPVSERTLSFPRARSELDPRSDPTPSTEPAPVRKVE